MSMRHIRDPITGAKVGLDDPNPEPAAQKPKPKPSFRDQATKVLYVNMGLASPQPNSMSPSPRLPTPTFTSDSPTSVSHVQYQPKTPPSPTSRSRNLLYVNHDSSTPRWPAARGRSPSPRRSVIPEHVNRSRPVEYGQYGRYVVNKHESAYFVGKTYQGGQWPQRRCYTLLWGLLLVFLLAAVVAGIYFLAKYIKQQQQLSAPNYLNPGGYYENGLYIITSTVAPPESMGIFGHDRPCNPYNNGSWSVLYPNCDTLTTRIVPINYTTTPDTLAVTVDSGHAVRSVTLLTLSGWIGLWILLASFSM